MQENMHPCALCQSPIGEGQLCNNCWEVDSRLPEFLEHENARECTKEIIRQIEARLEEDKE
jgi:hypothetical protein